MKFIALMGLILIAAAPALSAEFGGVNFSGESTEQGPTEGPRELLADAWNDTEAHATGTTYAAEHFGFPYTPTTSYTLNRVEWYAGGIGGAVTVSILGDSGSGFPDGPVLSSASYNESAAQGWQGANLSSPVALNAGTLYYVKYDIVVDANLSHASGGTLIPHYWYYDANGYWEGPGSFFNWMARFYGDVTTPAGTYSWSEVKGAY